MEVTRVSPAHNSIVHYLELMPAPRNTLTDSPRKLKFDPDLHIFPPQSFPHCLPTWQNFLPRKECCLTHLLCARHIVDAQKMWVELVCDLIQGLWWKPFKCFWIISLIIIETLDIFYGWRHGGSWELRWVTQGRWADTQAVHAPRPPPAPSSCPWASP